MIYVNLLMLPDSTNKRFSWDKPFSLKLEILRPLDLVSSHPMMFKSNVGPLSAFSSNEEQEIL